MYKFASRFAFIFCLIIALTSCSTTTSTYPVGAPAPYTKFQLLDGSYLLMDSLKGKTVVVLFWANWCSESKQEIERINEIAGQYRDRKDIVFIAVSLDKRRDDLERFIQWKKPDNLILAYSGNDVQDEAYVSFQCYVLPFGFVVDPSGTVVQKDKHLDLTKL